MCREYGLDQARREAVAPPPGGISWGSGGVTVPLNQGVYALTDIFLRGGW